MRIARWALVGCLTATLLPAPAAPSAAAAAATPREAIEGRWAGEAGPADNRAVFGLDVSRDGSGALAALLHCDLVHFFGVPLGAVEKVADGRYRVPAADLEIVVSGEQILVSGLLEEPKATLELHRTRHLPRRAAATSPPRGPGPRWRVRLGGAIFATAALRDGLAYVGNVDGVMVAISMSDGNPTWKFAAGRPIYGEALVTDDAVYFTCDGGFLIKLDRATGQERWRYDLGDGQVARTSPNPLIFDYDRGAPRPSLADGVLYVGSGDGSFHAVRADDGTRSWRVLAAGKVRASAAVVGPNVAFATTSGLVRMVERATGTTVWELDAHDPITSAPAIVQGRLIVGTRGSKLLALDAANGAALWSQFWWGSWVESTAVIDGARAYIGSGDLFRVSSIDTSTGRNEWRTDVGGWVLERPALTATRVYAGVSGARRRASFWVPQAAALVALDRADGRLRWSWPMSTAEGAFLQGFVAAPAIAEGLVVIGGVDGTLYAFPAE